MENKVTIYTEGTGWIEIDVSSFYKTQLTGEMAYLDVWNFKCPNSTNFYHRRGVWRAVQGGK